MFALTGWRRRAVRHAAFLHLSLAGAVLVALALPGRPTIVRLSMGTAYVSLGFLAATLLLGPWNLWRRRPNPVSTYLRRDLGIWAALTATAHTVFGLQVHIPGRPWEYFLWPLDRGHLLPFRYDAVGAANYPGLAGLLVLLLLLALSNDAALRRLGAGRWKALQRWNYAGFALIAAHAAIYQALERRAAPWVVLAAAVFVLVTAVQLIGRSRHRAGRSAR